MDTEFPEENKSIGGRCIYNKQAGTQVPQRYQLCWVIVGRGGTEPWSALDRGRRKKNNEFKPIVPEYGLQKPGI